MSTEKWILEHQDQIKAYRRKWYKENAKHAKRKVKERKDSLKEWLRSLKVGKSCKCGESDSRALDYHHIDPTNKLGCISNAAGGRGWSKEKTLKEIEKCVLMCSNCHRKTDSTYTYK